MLGPPLWMLPKAGLWLRASKYPYVQTLDILYVHRYTGAMSDTIVPLAEARANLSSLVKSAHAGSTFTITLSGLPVATLGPLTSSASVQDIHLGVDAYAPSHRPSEVPLEVHNSAGLVDDDDVPV